jgi:hypothetical protein
MTSEGGRSQESRFLIPAYPVHRVREASRYPGFLKLPKPLILTLNSDECDSSRFEKFSAVAKIYDDGALTLVVRYKPTPALKSSLP